MPWTCGKCGHDDIPDHGAVCPGCGDTKLAWTVNEGQTRRFKVALGARESFDVLTGDGEAPAERAVSLPRAVALDLAGRGLQPEPAQQLILRLKGRPGADLRSRVVIHYACQEPVERVLAGPSVVDAEGGGEVRLVLVHGEGEEVEFPGLEVVDVSEAVEPGHAPSVSLTALRKKARELRVEEVVPPVGRLWGWVGFEHVMLDHGLPKVTKNPNVLIQGVRHVDVKVLSGPPGADLTPRFTEMEGVFDFGEVPSGVYELEVSADGARQVHRVRVPLRDVDRWGAPLDLGPVTPTPRAKNLAIGKEVAALVNSEIKAVNQLTPEGLWNIVSGGIIDYPLMTYQSSKASPIEAEAAEIDQPPLSLTAPGPNYTFLRQIARIAREHSSGNCGEKAAAAAIACAARGLHPVEQFELLKADHSFCVVGRDPRSSCKDPRSWGKEAVVVDPWTDEVYPAIEINDWLRHFESKHEGLPFPPTKLVAIVKL